MRGGRAARRQAVRAFCDGRLAHYKIPRYVMLVDEFPMTVTGKVRKVEMREGPPQARARLTARWSSSERQRGRRWGLDDARRSFLAPGCSTTGAGPLVEQRAPASVVETP